MYAQTSDPNRHLEQGVTTQQFLGALMIPCAHLFCFCNSMTRIVTHASIKISRLKFLSRHLWDAMKTWGKNDSMYDLLVVYEKYDRVRYQRQWWILKIHLKSCVILDHELISSSQRSQARKPELPAPATSWYSSKTSNCSDTHASHPAEVNTGWTILPPALSLKGELLQISDFYYLKLPLRRRACRRLVWWNSWKWLQDTLFS